MTDRITKALGKLSASEETALKALLVRIRNGDFGGLDIKKLKGRGDIYRVRKGSLRVIFRKVDEEIRILAVERRSDTTYGKY